MKARMNDTPAKIIKAFRRLENMLFEMQQEATDIAMEAADICNDMDGPGNGTVLRAMSLIEDACDTATNEVDSILHGHDLGGGTSVDEAGSAIAKYERLRGRRAAKKAWKTMRARRAK